MQLFADIGGTKTCFKLTNKGQEIHSQRCKGFGLADDKERVDIPALSFVLKEVSIKSSGIDEIYINLGGKNSKQINRIFKEVFPDSKINLFRESEGTTAKSLAKKHGAGAVLFAGTGSIAFGYNKERDDMSVCGGWGSAFSDKGSGYYIGRSIIELCLVDLDGTEPLSELVRYLTGRVLPIPCGHGMDICAIRDSVRSRLNCNARDEVASLTAAVYEYAQKGDEKALFIFQKAGEALADIVNAAIKKSDCIDKKIVVTGGLVNTSRYWIDSFCKKTEISEGDVILRKDGIIEGMEYLYANEKQ